MKSALKTSVLCALATLFFGFTTTAQTQNPSKTAASHETFRAGQLIGSTAKDQQGHKIGDVKDFTMNPQTGEMFALVDIGGGHWATVPWQLVKINTDNSGNLAVTLNTSKNVLQGAPSVTKDQWTALQDPSYTRRVYSYFQVHPSGMGGQGEQTEKQQGAGQSAQTNQNQSLTNTNR